MKPLESAPEKVQRLKVRVRNVASTLLTSLVRLIFLPVTLAWGILVWLWSLPFRINGMRRQAKNCFLYANALERLLEEQDPSIGVWDLYCAFRHRLLSRTDSFFSACYTLLSERAHHSARELGELKGVPAHPAGWYRRADEGKRKNFLRFILKIIAFFVRAFVGTPARIKLFFTRMGRTLESSQSAFGAIARFLKRRGAVLAPLLVAVGVFFIIAFHFSTPMTLLVRVGDRELGYVESRQTVEEAVSEVEQTVAGAIGKTYVLPEHITYSYSKTLRPKYLSKADLVAALTPYTADHVREGYGLRVDGVLVAACESDVALFDLIERASQEAREATGNEEILLLSTPLVRYQVCPVDSFLTEEELGSLLKETTSADHRGAVIPLEAYRAKPLELSRRLEDGAAYTYTVSALGAPRLEEDSVGLIYGVREEKEETVEIPYNITYRESDTIYKGSRQVQTEGKVGSKLIVYNVYKSSDTEYSREVLSEALLSQPQERIVLIGTKPLPLSGDAGAAVGDRFLYYPVIDPEISSNWGDRELNGSEEFHHAIDLPKPQGTPIYAAASGVVVEAGESSEHWSYGNAVKIRHDNGMYTYYAHMESVTVRVGQKVTQNQMIGTVGQTGRAYGAHVHFEVRLSDGKTYVDPKKYLIGG